jgi:hypothetical protein
VQQSHVGSVNVRIRWLNGGVSWLMEIQLESIMDDHTTANI